MIKYILIAIAAYLLIGVVLVVAIGAWQGHLVYPRKKLVLGWPAVLLFVFLGVMEGRAATRERESGE